MGCEMDLRKAQRVGLFLLSTAVLIVFSRAGVAQNNLPLQTAASNDTDTPAATASIAASAGFIDVAGVKLGMPLKDALTALKAFNDKFKFEAFTNERYDVLPNTDMIYMVMA